MNPEVVKQLLDVKSSGLAINAKTAQIMHILKEAGMTYDLQIPPSQMLVHPGNRCGLLVNSFDSHEKGWKALQIGFDPTKLQGSICMELSKDPGMRAQQIQANEGLVLQAEGRLAAINGHERFCSLDCSHMTQFLKSCIAGCNTDHAELQKINSGVLSVESLVMQYKDKFFQELCTEGWKWRVVCCEAEAACPWLPSMLQASANSTNLVSKNATEIEVAASLAYHFGMTKNMQTAIDTTKAALPNISYMNSVGHYVQHFGGGDKGGFELIAFLQQLSKSFGHSLFLGEEYMDALAFTRFSDPSSTYPFLRASFWAAAMSSPKSADSISKLVTKSDIEKLKGTNMKTQIKTAETLLSLSWNLLSNTGSLHEKKGVRAMGHMMIRTALLLVKKEAKGKEGKTFGTLQKVHEAFTAEVGDGNAAGAATTAESSESGGELRIMSLQAGIHKHAWASAFKGFVFISL